MTLSRRKFLSVKSRHPTQAALPWQVVSNSLMLACNDCQRCAETCPTEIIRYSDKGLPYVDFKYGACELCGDCAKSCPEDYFSELTEPPWHQKVRYTENCIAFQAVYCRTCKDMCAEGAIKFEFETIANGLPRFEIEECTGCGACISTCPSDAIQLV